MMLYLLYLLVGVALAPYCLWHLDHWPWRWRDVPLVVGLAWGGLNLGMGAAGLLALGPG